MRRSALAAIALTVGIAVACSSTTTVGVDQTAPTDGMGVEETVASTAAPSDDSPPENGPIVVATGARRDQLVVMDPADGSSRSIDPPPDLVGPPEVYHVVGGPSGVHALAITPEDAFVFEVATGAVRTTAPVGDLLGVAPIAAPEAALFVHADRLNVVDLRTGVMIDAGQSSPGLAQLQVDPASRRAVVSRGSGGGEVVDLDSGTRRPVDDRISMPYDALSPDGQQVAGFRRDRAVSRESQLVVFDFDDPESTTVWYQARSPEQQLSGYRWSGYVIVAADYTGRIIALDGVDVVEIGRIGEAGEETASARVYSAPNTGVVLIQRTEPTSERWFRIDPRARSFESLPALDGFVPIGGQRLPNALLLGIGDRLEWEKLVVMPVESGGPVEILALDAPEQVVVSTVGDDLVQLRFFEGMDRSFRLLSAADGQVLLRKASTGPVSVSPDRTSVAVIAGRQNPEVVLHSLDVPQQPVRLGEGTPLAWLGPAHES